MQLAKAFGTDVTGACSTAKRNLVKSLGADKVIDYTSEDFTQSGKTYDILFDTIGKSSFSGCLKSLKQNGIYLRAVHRDLPSVLRGLWVSKTTNKKVIGGMAIARKEDLIFLKELIEARKIKSVIDRCYSLEQTADAHRYVEQGYQKRNVVITVKHRHETWRSRCIETLHQVHKARWFLAFGHCSRPPTDTECSPPFVHTVTGSALIRIF